MKKWSLIIGAILFVLVVMVLWYILLFNQDQKNALARKSIEYLDGNYLITFSNGPVNKFWTINKGKVTTTEKGYYYFWDNKKHYIQVPIQNTIVEEVD